MAAVQSFLQTKSAALILSVALVLLPLASTLLLEDNG
jgi:hypothetical protein